MRSLLATAFITTLLATGAASAADQRRAGSSHHVHTIESVAPGQVLVIDLPTGAGLSITGWDRNEIAVESDWSESSCPGARLEVTRTSSGVLLETRYTADDHRYTRHCSFGVEVRVPRRFDIRLHSAGGSVAIADVHGSISGTTGGGKIELYRLRGAVRLRTGGGKIHARDSDLDGSIATGGGQVLFENVSGDVTGRSGNVRGVVRGRPRSGARGTL